MDDKRTGAIILVMQRLHQDDLAGTLLQRSGEWTVLNFPAIAQEDERIAIGDDVFHVRKAGDLLHAEREPMQVLNDLRQQVGPEIFAAQYQQNPVPFGGNMIKREWVHRYERAPSRTSSTVVLQSWDTASKDGSENDWSVCTTWYVVDGNYYLVDVLRGRFNYPELKSRAIAHAKQHKPDKILVEDNGVGTALISELVASGFSAIAIQPEQNKLTRMSIQSAKFEAGRVFLPKQAIWLPDLEAELFAFPAARHDDQVDSISQALNHQIQRALWDEKSIEGLRRFTEALVWDRYFGRVTGRPW